jgi:hypothetical protein
MLDSSVAQAAKKQRLDHAAWLERRAEDLNAILPEMMPDSEIHGEQSWTKKSSNGACVEVLLNKKALFVKKTAPGVGALACRTVAFNRFDSIRECWEHAKTLAGWA